MYKLKQRSLHLCLLVFTLFSLNLWGIISYEVKFQGVPERETLGLLKEHSRSVLLADNPPQTKAGLKRRAESDIPDLLKVLQSVGYYSAKVHVKVHDQTHPAQVLFQIDTGVLYPLVSFKIVGEDKKYACPFDFSLISLADLEIELNRPALPKNIINAEDILLQKMAKLGYPLADVVKREILADQSCKTISVILHVDSGPLCYFGETTIEGQKTICDDFFRKKIEWCVGDIYNPKLLERTQNNLEASGLFSSITITHADHAVENGLLPMTISVLEGKQRSIAAGLSYATEQGPGVLAEWEHRNIRGCGEKLSLKTNIAQREKQGRLLYLIPDFRRPKQDFLWLLEAQQLIVRRSFEASSVSLSGIIERQISDPLRISYGGMYKFLKDTHSENNGTFHLAKAPFQLRWNKANNLLDPTKGHVVTFKTIPTVRIFSSDPFAYCINNFIFTNYFSLTEDSKFVLANKLNVGSIFGPGSHVIPSSELLYAGSDNNLRGYTFMTVSPLDHGRKPEGGRSLLTFSTDLRIRINDTWGFVLFHDIGNVYRKFYPELNQKVLQSVGLGARYNTPVGPLRVDLAFPLNRRRHLDSFFQLYFSIGQAF